jgi:hypothetical protein
MELRFVLPRESPRPLRGQLPDMFRRALTQMLGAAVLSCLWMYGDIVNGQDINNARGGLPREPESPSEILAAAHLFTVECTALAGTPWVREADGLEHRKLGMKLRLQQNLKGPLRVAAGSPFDLIVQQKREDALTVSDYHGFWSHAEPQQNGHYLVISNGEGDDPAALMQEPGIKELANAALASDVTLAISAEERLGASLRPENDGTRRRGAALELLKLTNDRRANADRLFAGYAWARIKPIYSSAEEYLLPPLLYIIEAKDTANSVRGSLVYGLWDEATDLGLSKERVRKLLGPFLRLLALPVAAPMHDRLLQVPIYNLLFQFGGAESSAAEIVPDETARRTMIDTASRARSERAADVAKWLRGGK